MRAAIFIDGGYLLKQLQDAKAVPDYSRIAEFLLEPLRRRAPLDLMRCYFYYCPPWASDKPTEVEKRRLATHERFVADIHSLDRWQIRLGKLERRREGDKEVFAQKRVDVQLSVDLVHHTAAGHVQHVVLVAGDSDFIPAIVAAKDAGATLTLWCDRDKSVHKDLLHHADEVHYIDWPSFPKASARSAAAAPELDDSGMPVSGRRPRSRTRAAAPPAAPGPAALVEGALPSGIKAELASAAEIAEAEQAARGRGRNSGRGRGADKRGAPAAADGDAPASSPARPQSTRAPTARGASARPSAPRREAPRPAAAPREEPQRPPAPSRAHRPPPAKAVAPAAGAGDGDGDGDGDGIGNQRDDADAEAGGLPGGKRRRRRGGRGRRRKTGAGPAGGADPA